MAKRRPDLRYGQLVELEARVRRIRNFQNPGEPSITKASRHAATFIGPLLPQPELGRNSDHRETGPLRIALS